MFVANNQSIIKNQASIHIGTLARYNKYISGDAMYALDGINKMTGSARFLGWPEQKRKCSLEKYEACQLRGFLETSKQCGCIPFQLLPGTKDKKKVHMIFLIYNPILHPGLFDKWNRMYKKEICYGLSSCLQRTLFRPV